jgi:aspartyl-tRNA(Asn)/glutamyl-tRNA(Gln) amidotransferase subunit A
VSPVRFLPERASLTETARAIREGEIDAAWLARWTLDRALKLDERLGVFVTLSGEEDLLAAAEDIDRRRASGAPLGPLAGVPFVLKDNMTVRGLPTTCGSRILERFHSPYDATAAARLLAADGLLLGKYNLDEFAMGSSTENSACPTRIHGTSAASPEVERRQRGRSRRAHRPGALGSDTGGSVRQPAALRRRRAEADVRARLALRLVAFGSSLDQIGPITRTVEDAALLWASSRAPTSTTRPARPRPFRLRGAIPARARALRVGVPRSTSAPGSIPRS